MNVTHLVPELALARVVAAGGPYRPGDDLSLAFITPTVSRIVAHDAALRARCVPLEGALVPETVAVVITHCAAPYKSGEILTLSFVDPRVARIHESLERQARNVVTASSSEAMTLDVAEGELPSQRFTQNVTAQLNDARAQVEGEIAEHRSDSRSGASAPAQTTDEQQGASLSSPANVTAERRTGERFETEIPAAPSRDEQQGATLPSSAKTTAEMRTGGRLGADGPAAPSRPASGISHSERRLTRNELGVSSSLSGLLSAQIGAGEPTTLSGNARLKGDTAGDSTGNKSAGNDTSLHDGEAANGRSGFAENESDRKPSPRAHASSSEGVTIRLEWKSERLRRFVQVVDKLFTIDRVGWYRHSLAMRLLIPDEIACGDQLANVEAMRHLQALRAAAVESLGKPLLAACMPGFSISSEWLESIESSREARAIAGLRDALLPYANDGDGASDVPSGEALYTTGTISRAELLAENATSVEAFLPVLIPTTARDAALGLRLAEYRRLLIELFAQTARAGEPVRLQQMAQPNHSLDDRLWQLVGAAAEAFGGFAHA